MTRTFKRHVGTTPSEYRRQARRRPSRPDPSR
jgi:AraC-like DNA-binding protein